LTIKVLKAVVYGDAALFAERPELMEAKVWVHFHSSSRKYSRIECWGKEATKVQYVYYLVAIYVVV
jgi:magnesium dechelatase